MKVVISFDLDGTLSFGDPPGPIEPEHLNKLKKGKYTIGGASGKEIEYQKKKWEENGITPQFIVKKQKMKKLKKMNADKYIHVGDMEDDAELADNAGFRFLNPYQFIKLFL